ncbi:TM2 domain-containing protein [Arcanobacterium ihumii]|uniref:TM2 domain-containing protein n=1 Tax=Arcanobacterium ihumii TaxID=2138162 RepID=UPI000F52EAF2|nr:TM2 domain-containing protein [Arcanobacterium ihumii]
MEDKTQKSELNSVFSAAPDPLLDLRADDVDVNIYEPGSLFSRQNSPDASVSAKEKFTQTNPDFDSAWKAHPSQFGRKQPTTPLAQTSPHSEPRSTAFSLPAKRSGKSRGTAIALGLFFGFQGAHNFYWGEPRRGIIDLVLWILCLFAFTFSANIFLMLPAVAYVCVELVFLGMGRGIYHQEV